MPDDKDALPSPSPTPDPQLGEHGDTGVFSEHPPLRRGYQTPQDQSDHWDGPADKNKE